MKKSRRTPARISLTLMAGLAAACSAAACSSGDDAGQRTASGEWGEGEPAETRYCADSATGRVVSNDECARPRTGGGFYPFLWYYGGRTMMGANGATYVTGASRTPTVRAPGSRGTISRGGFGATAGRTGTSVSVRT